MLSAVQRVGSERQLVLSSESKKSADTQSHHLNMCLLSSRFSQRLSSRSSRSSILSSQQVSNLETNQNNHSPLKEVKKIYIDLMAYCKGEGTQKNVRFLKPWVQILLGLGLIVASVASFALSPINGISALLGGGLGLLGIHCVALGIKNIYCNNKIKEFEVDVINPADDSQLKNDLHIEFCDDAHDSLSHGAITSPTNIKSYQIDTSGKRAARFKSWQDSTFSHSHWALQSTQIEGSDCEEYDRGRQATIQDVFRYYQNGTENSGVGGRILKNDQDSFDSLDSNSFSHKTLVENRQLIGSMVKSVGALYPPPRSIDVISGELMAARERFQTLSQQDESVRLPGTLRHLWVAKNKVSILEGELQRAQSQQILSLADEEAPCANESLVGFSSEARRSSVGNVCFEDSRNSKSSEKFYVL